MSNIGYFTTSPVILMRRRQAASGGTTTTTTAGTTTTTTAATTTTTTCGTYNIDIYAKSPKSCQLNATECECGLFICYCAVEPVTVTLQYSTDNGSNWFSAANFTGLDDQCTYIETFAIGSCESSLIFRVSTDTCTGVLFNYTANSSTCPAVGLCASSTCTETETINVMPTGNTSIAFSICTECVDGCCIPCCP